jgi:hypothetical protein
MNKIVILLLSLITTSVYADQIKCNTEGQVTISSDTKLYNSCVYNIQININSSNVTLDCDGAVLDGEKNEAIQYGVLIDSKGNPLSNITIKNCTFKNYFKNAIMASWMLSDSGKLKLVNNDKEALYAKTPNNIKIYNTVVENPQRVGIFIDDYVSNTELSGVSVLNGREVAVYLEHDSRNTTIKNSVMEGNGQWGSRESLAIDASNDNVIVDNVFRNNAIGGVFLYKNCGEMGDRSEPAFYNANATTRTHGANGNIIKNNTFVNTGLAIYIGSRQDVPLNIQHCSDPLMYTGRPIVYRKVVGDKYYQDYAKNNLVERNELECSTGIYVADDDNQVIANHFSGDCPQEIKVGSEVKGVFYGEPIKNNKVEGNNGDAQVNFIGNAK